MIRTTRAAAALVGTLLSGLLVGCGGEEAPSAGTDATTRSLLNQDAVGGPSTPLAGSPELAGRAGSSALPQLGHNFGDVEAPLKLIEFSDFGCGYCRQFHSETFAALHEQFVETGRIEWKFLPFITGTFENSLAVTEAAECTLEQDETTFRALSDRLWERQAEWKGSGEPEAIVRSWARELGADMERFDSCLAEDRRIERVASATLVAQQLGVRGTPTFWIVGYGPLQGALPLDAFSGILGAVLEDVEAARDSVAVDSIAADSGAPS
jgi:protein-disulfide isomerase